MLLVTADTVGAAAYARMVREGVIAPVLAGVALPRDIVLTPALRRHVLASIAPAGTQVTALAALWAHACAPRPRRLDVRVLRRAGVRRDPRSLPVVVHVVSDADWTLGSPVAEPRRAALDALLWSPPDLAVPAVLCALDAGLVTAPQLQAGAVDGNHAGLVAVEEAVRQREANSGQVRLEPVMRRAS